MSERANLAATLGSALLLASLATYAVADVLGLQTSAATGHKRFGSTRGPADALICGSSLTYDAIAWSDIAGRLVHSIESWPVPGSSPAEWEQLQKRSPEATTTFVGVSLYDLNEAWLCDFRADIVPFRQTVADLWNSAADAAFARRLASWYALRWTRMMYPTAGRSDRVIFGVRDKAIELAGRGRASGDEAPLRLAADFTSEDRLSDWPDDRLLRRLDSMRRLQGTPGFSGPKHLALLRLLRQAGRQGEVVVLVLPVSRPYVSGLLDAAALKRFEAALARAREATPGALWVRLDRIETLASTDYFYDLVHLNMRGRRIATTALLSAMEAAGTRQ